MKIKLTLTSVVLSVSLLVSGIAIAKNNKDSLSTAQKQQVEQIIHDYLLRNPEILIQVQQQLQHQQAQKMQQFEQKAKQRIPNLSKDIFNSPSSPIGGNPQGHITLVEFFDYQCPHCKEMAAIVDEIISKNPQLRVVYKEFPIFSGSSIYAAKAALAAQKQGKYLAFHDALMHADNPLSNEKILAIAKQSGLDVNQLKKEMKSKAIDTEIKNNQKLAKKLEILATPTFIIGKTQDADSKSSFMIPSMMSEENLQDLVNHVTQFKNS